MDANPTYQFDEKTSRHVWNYSDTTALQVFSGHPDARGRLMADVEAFAGKTRLNRARLDLLSQDDRAKFHANTQARMAELNGAIPVEDAKRASWFARLVDIIPIIEAAPATPSATMALTRLGDLLNEPETTIEWLVDEVLPSGGFSVLAAKPKVGKSTLARQLALSIARGESFLGRRTAQGAVIYLALEEKRSEVRKHFRDMGATGGEEIYIFASTAPIDAFAQIRTVVEEQKPALLIIDPLFRFTRMKDGNDYAQVTSALEPLLTLAREIGTHVLCVHHEGKGDRPGGDAILGSTAIFGSVDTAISLRRSERYRTISSTQRYGTDIEETTLRFDPATRTTTLGETKEREEEGRLGEGILAYLQTKDESVTEAEIDNDVEGKTRIRRKALRDLVAARKIIRSGKGGKSDPFRYTIADTLANQAGNKNPTDETRDNTEPLPHAGVLVPLFPGIYGEQENKNRKSDLTSQKDEAYSCSRDFGESPTIATTGPLAGNKNRPQIPQPCAGCREAFTPLHDGASKTLCRVCQAELRRDHR